MDNLVSGNRVSETLDELIAKKDFKTILAAAETGSYSILTVLLIL